MCCSGRHSTLCCTDLPAGCWDLSMATYVSCFAHKWACVQSSHTCSALLLTQGTSAFWPVKSVLMLLPGLLFTALYACVDALWLSIDAGHQALPGNLCCRLPPIERRWTAGMTRDAFMNRGYTFQCPAWQQCKLHQVLLTKVSTYSRCACTFHSSESSEACIPLLHATLSCVCTTKCAWQQSNPLGCHGQHSCAYLQHSAWTAARYHYASSLAAELRANVSDQGL